MFIASPFKEDILPLLLSRKKLRYEKVQKCVAKHGCILLSWHQFANHIIYDITNIFCFIFARKKETLSQVKSHEKRLPQTSQDQLQKSHHKPPSTVF